MLPENLTISVILRSRLYKIKSNKPKHDEEDLNFVGDVGTLCSIDDGPKCD